MNYFEHMKYIENAEANREIRQDTRMEFSRELLERPIRPGEPGYDKVFILGKVEKDEVAKKWNIKIESETPTVTLNEKVRNEFDLQSSPLVSEIREKRNSPELSLISGGSFIWIIESGIPRLICIRRDKDAPVEAGSLTGPAGRCGEAPSDTAVGETNEELIIIKSKLDSSDHFKLLGFYRNEEEREKNIHQKLCQVETIYNNLIQKGKNDDAKFLRLIRGEDDIEMLNVRSFKNKDQNLEEIVTIVDGREIDRIRSGTAFFDKASNTLEIREVLEVPLPEHVKLCKVLDGEVFGREIKLIKSINELKDEKMVPSLYNYYRETLSRNKTSD